VAPDLDAWTAGGLRPGALALPAVGAELFIQAGAIVAERLSGGSGDPALVDATLRRAAQQAGQLLKPSNAAAARSTS
jgi:hypothetical protein